MRSTDAVLAARASVETLADGATARISGLAAGTGRGREPLRGRDAEEGEAPWIPGRRTRKAGRGSSAGILGGEQRRRGVDGMVGGRNWTRTDATPAAMDADGRMEDVPPRRKRDGTLRLVPTPCGRRRSAWTLAWARGRAARTDGAEGWNGRGFG